MMPLIGMIINHDVWIKQFNKLEWLNLTLYHSKLSAKNFYCVKCLAHQYIDKYIEQMKVDWLMKILFL